MCGTLKPLLIKLLRIGNVPLVNQKRYKLAQDLLDKLQEQPGGQQIITQNISNVKYAATSGTGNASISGITEHSTSKDD